MPLWSTSRYPFFTFSFLKILPNFNLLRSLELSFGPLFRRIYGRHLFPLFQVLVESLSKSCHFLKNATRVEIIITVTEENCMNIRAKIFVILYENCSTNCYCNFNTCGVFACNTVNYYMPSSVSGQDEPNLALWLATRAGKMELSCPLGIRTLSRKYNLSCFGPRRSP